ncbi:CLUMA_CG006287, isoform A, partial [Clunio marinus]
MTHMRRRRLNLVIVLSLVSILTLIALFGTYAYFKVYQEDSPQISITDEYFNEPSDLVRHKRATNFINKIDSERDDVDDMNKIKRNAVVEDINSFLNLKYQEINGNDANEEINDEGTLISKRSSNFKNSIRKLKENIKHNKIMINDNENVSDESINLILKDLRDIEEEIRDIDDDIISLLETAAMADNSIHKRVRHKRETNSIQNIDPITYKLYFPIFEEKKREKRLVQEKFTEVRDEFIRCKKSTKDGKRDCNEIYSKVMDRFREITKKFKEIEEIVDEMEDYHSSSRSNDSRERKKEKKKNKKKNKEEKSSSESDESSEENVKTSTPWWEQSSPSTNKTTSLEPETTTLEVTTTVEEDISTIETTNSEDMTTTQSPIETTTNDETTVQPATIFDFHDKKDS